MKISNANRPLIGRAAVATLGLGLAMMGQSAAFAKGVGPGAPGGRQGKGGKGHPRLERLADKLNLTPAQKARIKPILQNAAAQLKALRANTSLTDEQRMAQRKQIRRQSMAQIRPLLTPAQQAQLPARRDRREDGKGRKNARRGG